MRAIVVAALLAACGGSDPGEFPSQERFAEFCAEVYCPCTFPDDIDQCVQDCDTLFTENCTNAGLDRVEACIQTQLDADACTITTAGECAQDNPC